MRSKYTKAFRLVAVKVKSSVKFTIEEGSLDVMLPDKTCYDE